MENQKIKINNKTFEIVFPNLDENLPAKIKFMKGWMDLVRNQEDETKLDEWTEINGLEGYKFKNLKFVGQENDLDNKNIEITYTLKCDEWKQDL